MLALQPYKVGWWNTYYSQHPKEDKSTHTVGKRQVFGL